MMKKELGIFSIILVVAIGLFIGFNALNTYTTNLAILRAKRKTEQETLADLKKEELQQTDTTDVRMNMRLYEFKDTLVVEVVQGDDQYLPTNLVYERSDGFKYTMFAKFYHVFTKTDGNLDYYGYLARGRWFGRKGFKEIFGLFDPHWQSENIMFKSEDAYLDSFRYIFTGTVSSGDPNYDMCAGQNVVDSKYTDWANFTADYVSNFAWLNTAKIESFFTQLRNFEYYQNNPSGCLTFDKTYFTSRVGSTTGNIVNPKPVLGFDKTNLQDIEFFSYSNFAKLFNLIDKE